MGLLIGGALGALAAIFFAPKSGRELRADIREKGCDVLKDAKEIYDHAGEKITGEVQEKIGQVKKVLGK